MAKNIFSTFGKKTIPDSSVYLLNLNSDEKSPLLKSEGEYSPEIPIIGIGGAGIKITNEIVARLKLYNSNMVTMGIDIDALTPEQQQYLDSWEEGT